MDLPDGVVGVLLAGGKSSRMGGGDKCLRPLAGKTILSRIVDRLRPQVSDLIINANGDASRFAPFGLPVAADSVAGFAGPLAGVHAGLSWTKANRPGAVYIVTVAADTPFFPTDLVQRFLAEAKTASTLLVAQSAKGIHPVVGLWPVALEGELEASLKQGVRRVSAWVRDHGAVEIFFPPLDLDGTRIDPFFNINAPDDLAVAEAFLSESAR